MKRPCARLAAAMALLLLGAGGTRSAAQSAPADPADEAKRTLEQITIAATVAGNVADCYPELKAEQPLCFGDGRGDNHSGALPAAPRYVAAALNGPESSGDGAKGKSRIHMEWNIRELAGERIDSARVQVTTHRGAADSVLTYFHYVTHGGDGELTDSDYQSPASAIPRAVMAVPPPNKLAVGESGLFRFDVTTQLRDALRKNRDYLVIQGRLRDRRRVPPEPLMRGLEIHAACDCGDRKDWPQLFVLVER